MFKVYVLSSVGGGPKFSEGVHICSKISSGGSLFIEKFNPGGTNFEGSIFTITVHIDLEAKGLVSYIYRIK